MVAILLQKYMLMGLAIEYRAICNRVRVDKVYKIEIFLVSML